VIVNGNGRRRPGKRIPSATAPPREDGNLAGYRWGLERKKALLATELKAIEA